jgi:hypothetical protein
MPPATPEAPGSTFLIAAAGDIAGRLNRQDLTAELLLGLRAQAGLAAVLALGDLQYPRGEYHDFLAYYDPTWGVPVLKAITRPVPGNHEYDQGRSNADGYFDYFNGRGKEDGPAGARGLGYYSFDMGDWHFIALNSSDGCQRVSCARGSPMHRWLVADLAATTKKCVLAYWHHPRFQQGVYHRDLPQIAPLWDALYDAHADVVLSGHDHNFQQLAPLDKKGALDPEHGIRSFVVGTGGALPYLEFDERLHPGASENHLSARPGVLALALEPGAYRWKFLGARGGPSGEVLAEGRDVCR